MNFRITTLLFGLLLTMLWVFGLMIAHKKSTGDQSFVMAGPFQDAKIEKVHVKRIDKEKGKETTVEAEFVAIDGKWFLQSGKQKVRIDGFRIDDKIVKVIKEARQDETADVSKDLATYGLDNPRIVVTLTGKEKDKTEDTTWKFYVGNDPAGIAYVSSSDREGRVFAVSKKSLEGLEFKDPNYFRTKRLFDFVDATVSRIVAKKNGKELELKKAEGTRWTFLKPANLGFTLYESQPEEDPGKDKKKKKDPFLPKEKEKPSDGGGVKALLSHIINIRVDDDEHFVPLGKAHAEFGVEAGKEKLRIEVISSKDDKEEPAETLLVGNTEEVVVGKEKTLYYYVRLDTDDGVMKVNAKWLDPVIEAIEKPEKLRIRDVAAFDAKLVDAVIIKKGTTEEARFFRGESEAPKPINPHMPEPPAAPQQWSLILGGEKKKAGEAGVQALIDLVHGRRGIVEYLDGPKDEVKWGLDKPTAEISVYIDGIDKKKKDDAKKDDKKDDKKDAIPTLKTDHKPEVTLYLGNIDKDKDTVYVKRVLKDKSETYFTMKKDLHEKALPEQGIELAYLEASVPSFDPNHVAMLTLKRTTDKGTETDDLVHGAIEGDLAWFIKEGKEYKLADSAHANSILMRLSRLPVNKWVKKLGDKEGLDKLGYKPVVTATITVKKDPIGATKLAVKDDKGKDISIHTAVGLLGMDNPFLVATQAAAARELDPGEVYTVELGKDTDVEKDKPGAFATHSGAPKLLFLTPTHFVKSILKEDLRDRSGVLFTQMELVTMRWGNVAVNPANALMLASPYITGTVHNIDSEKVAKVNLTVRTSFELRSFQFDRIAKKEEPKPKVEVKKEEVKKEEVKKEEVKKNGVKKEEAKKEEAKDKEKDKVSKWTWENKTVPTILEFQLDPDKVAQLVKDFGKLSTHRFVSVLGDKRAEHKLTPDKATVKLDLVLDDGKTTITLIIGARYQAQGYFALSSAWPDTVFFVPDSLVEPLLDGVRHFAKERTSAD